MKVLGIILLAIFIIMAMIITKVAINKKNKTEAEEFAIPMLIAVLWFCIILVIASL